VIFRPIFERATRDLFFHVCYAFLILAQREVHGRNTRLKHTVLNDSTILSERIKEDYGTKRVLNFDSVLNEQTELINIKNAF
jgi:hypothetical protein